MYKRVLLKLSGEALGIKSSDNIIDVESLNSVCEKIKALHDEGLEVAIVIGAGNIWRGKTAEGLGMDRAQADYMGMLATIMNGLAVQDALEQVGVPTRVMTAIDCDKVAETYIRRRAIRHLEKGRVCIFVGGLGSPYFSTDTACVLRATEIEAEVVLMAKNHTEGIYDADPRTNKDAKLYKEITFSEILEKELKVMDSTAASLCKDNKKPLIVFNMNKSGNIVKAVMGEHIGTLVRVE